MKTINLSFDPKSFFKKNLLLTLLSALFATCLSCSSTKHITQLVHDVHIDTCYLSNIRYDSIYINCSSDVDRTRDTITITKTKTEFRYKLLRDTIFKVQCDSIPYPVRVTEYVEVTKPPNIFDKICKYFFFISIGAFLFMLYRQIRNMRQL